MRLLFGILLVLFMIGCIFDSKESGTRFTAGLSGEIFDTVYAYGTDGTRGQALGLGFEWRAEESGEVEFWQDLPGLDSLLLTEQRDSTDLADTSQAVPAGGNYYRLSVSPNSSFLLSLEDLGILLPIFDTVAAYSGMPCSFSEPRGYQIDTNGGAFTRIPLVMHNPQWTGTASHRGLILLIDTAASKSADARVDFSRAHYFSTTVKISCP